jgi:putative ABC transport system permease protein
MTPRWLLPLVLARRELRGGIKGFRIFLACLTLGVAAIATVQSLSSGIIQGLREDGTAILGGDVSFRTLYTPIAEDQLTWLGGQGRIDRGADMRAMAEEERDAAAQRVPVHAGGAVAVDVATALLGQQFQ